MSNLGSLTDFRLRFGTAVAGLLLCATLCWAQNAGPATTHSRTPPQLLLFRLRLTGLQPSTLTIPEGSYAIRIVNGVVLGDIDFQISRHGIPLTARQMKMGAGVLRFPAELSAGEYILFARGKPEWRCRITVVKKS